MVLHPATKLFHIYLIYSFVYVSQRVFPYRYWHQWQKFLPTEPSQKSTPLEGSHPLPLLYPLSSLPCLHSSASQSDRCCRCQQPYFRHFFIWAGPRSSWQVPWQPGAVATEVSIDASAVTRLGSRGSAPAQAAVAE